MKSKIYKPLDGATLTTEQKLGLLLCANLNHGERDLEDALLMIREHRLGSVWVPFHLANRDEILRRVWEAADYPLLVMCDAECGYPGYEIPSAISLAAAGARDDDARAFGRLSATLYRRLGYNTLCNPILDGRTWNAPCGGTTRILSPDREVVARLGAEIVRGMHEGGALSVAKHYPSAQRSMPFDSHMREGHAEDTREELIADALYPYRALLSEDLLDGVMVGHVLLPNIDPERPASLSRPVMDILRECGFDGFYMSDALMMMGVAMKYGDYRPTAMAVAAGCDLPLSWSIPCREAYRVLLEAYEGGEITGKRLEASVTRVLETQRKLALLPQDAEPLEGDIACLARLDAACVSGVIEEGLSPAIPRDGRHLFILMTDSSLPAEDEFDAFAVSWYRPRTIEAHIRTLFPHSEVVTHPNFPNAKQNYFLLKRQEAYDDIVYITYYKSEAFIGKECLTRRTVDLLDALQSRDRIAAHLHFGNPFVATDAPYIPRVLLGLGSEGCILRTLDILAGEAPLVGTQPYAPYLHFHKKGDVL